MSKFWKWMTNKLTDDKGEEITEQVLVLDGPISDEPWWGDEVTPEEFRQDLAKVKGDITVRINSPGGDVFAGSQIYNMLREHKGKVTVKIDAVAASAASVVAAAGDEVLVSPTSMLMIHNPATIAMGDQKTMQKAIEVLDEIKQSIINAYREKTGLSDAKLSRMMDEETWMNAREAIELKFADGYIDRGYDPDAERETPEPDDESHQGEPDGGENPEGAEKAKPVLNQGGAAMIYSRGQYLRTLRNMFMVEDTTVADGDEQAEPETAEPEQTEPVDSGVSAAELMAKLREIKDNF